MNLSTDQRYWDEQARTDPMWAILTDPEKRGRRWDPEEFFSSGVQEIAVVMERAARLGLPAVAASGARFRVRRGPPDAAFGGSF